MQVVILNIVNGILVVYCDIVVHNKTNINYSLFGGGSYFGIVDYGGAFVFSIADPYTTNYWHIG